MKYASELLATVGVVACGVLFLQHMVSLLLGVHQGGVNRPDSIDTLLFGIGLLAFLALSRKFARNTEQP
jgi:hypothetical protein